MPYKKERLYKIILGDAFGVQVAETAIFLHRNPRSYLWDITQGTKKLKLAPRELNFCLAVLYQHQLLKVTQSLRNADLKEFSLDEEKIIYFVLFPKFLEVFEKKKTKVHGAILQELFVRGRDPSSSVVFNAATYLKTATADSSISIQEIINRFRDLVQERYIVPVPPLDGSTPHASDLGPVRPDVQQMIARALAEDVVSLKDQPDQNELWTVNFTRLEQDLRNDLLQEAAVSSIDSDAAEVLGLFLVLIDDLARKGEFLNLKNDEVASQAQRRQLATKVKFVNQYLQILAEDGFIDKVEGAVDGTYTVNYAKSLEKLARGVVESAVLTLGRHSLRLFTAIESLGLVSVETLYTKIVLARSDVDRRLAQLVRKGYVTQYDFMKPGQSSARNVVWNPTLQKVEFRKVASTVLHRCYHALLNAKVIAKQDSDESADIFQKHQKYEALTEEVAQALEAEPEREEELQEVLRNFFTQEDRNQYLGAQKKSWLLNGAELKIALDILLLESYLSAVTVKFVPKTKGSILG